MAILPNLRSVRASSTTSNVEGLPSGSGSLGSPPKKMWTTILPLIVVAVVVSEIAFLGRLDMAKNAALLVDSWADAFSFKSYSSVDSSRGRENLMFSLVGDEFADNSHRDRQYADETEDKSKADLMPDFGSCEKWLEREDAVVYTRDFKEQPILVAGGEHENFQNCAVGCRFGRHDGTAPDATFGYSEYSGIPSVLRSMESSKYYPDIEISVARRKRFEIVMTTSLSSDVPVGYFSWAEYDIMAPMERKTEKALAAAFISNCGAHNFRLQALDALENLSIPIDSYGSCHKNRHESVDKVDALKRYKFSLAFENSNEEDYVTEKFFQSLVAGTIPVVIGAPNIEDFSPASGAILHIKEIADIPNIAKQMRYLDNNSSAYNHSLRWKFEGPSDSFKALVDMAAVHSSCRLCIHLATKLREKEAKSQVKKRPCKCTSGGETVHHLLVRERGRFEMESVFLRSRNITISALENAVAKKFESMKHVPIWKTERPLSLRGNGLRIYRIYPVGITQREALYGFKFGRDDEFGTYLAANPCPEFEVIFV